ncbi:hypothetical protein [Haloferax mucosum]|uniref:hypothetical protein n=1 Tax=Haloferax mucosum TaxID=403181 RepID=UPI001F4CAD2C|nr:hypothetical protein [Haloferax mucosum]
MSSQTPTHPGKTEERLSPVVNFGHRKSVRLKALIREHIDVSSLDESALNAETRSVIANNGGLYINAPVDAVDWFGLSRGDRVRVRTFPDAIVITREDADEF